MKVELWDTARVKPYAGNPRKNDASVDAVARSITEFGFRVPIVVDADGVVITGHTRLKAAIKLSLPKVPVHVARELKPEQVRAYRIADNAAGQKSEWDCELLPIELGAVRDSGYDLAATCLDASAIERMLGGGGDGPTGGVPDGSAYREQYGVIVVCEDEAHQKQTYEALKAAGHKCRVVCT